MSSQTQLAPELLVRIFHFLPLTDRRVCLSICKSWHTMAKVAYFSQISVLTNTNISELITILQTNGDLVKSLIINLNSGLTYRELIELITACPFLLRLKLHSRYCHWVLQCGFTLSKLKSVSTCEISTVRRRNCYRHLYRIAHRHSSSIEDLIIQNTNDLLIQQEFNGVMEYLSHFESLKCLKLVNGHQAAPDYFDTLLTSCKTLKELYINYSNPLYPPTAVSKELGRINYPSMRKLGIILANISIEYLQYIVDRFINLTVLDVRIKESNVVDWDHSEQQICHFIQHKFIPFTKSLSLSSLKIKINGSSLLGTLSAQLFCEYSNIEKARFEIKMNTLLLRTQIKIETKQDSATLLHLKFLRDFSLDENINLPYVPHLTNYGNRIRSLEIQSSESVNFNFIMDHCCNLKKLNISIKQVLPLINRAQQNPVDTAYVPTINVSKTNNILYDTLVDLKITGGTITPDLIDFLSSHVPNLKILSIIRCSMQIDSRTNIIDMTDLNLDMFVLDTKYVRDISSSYLCFIIRVPGFDTKYYLYDYRRVRQLSSYERIPADTTTISLQFNSLIQVKIHTGGENSEIISY